MSWATPPISPHSRARGGEGGPAVTTSRDDDQNIYLTIYRRRLRPDVKIISRCVRERNVSTLHRAGADFVLSDGWMGATAIFNCLNRTGHPYGRRGLQVCETEVPPCSWARRSRKPPCHARRVASSRFAHPGLRINPAADEAMQSGHRIILICTPEAEHRFLEHMARASPVGRQ